MPILLIAVAACAPALRDRDAGVDGTSNARAFLDLAAISAAQLEIVAVTSRPVGARPPAPVLLDQEMASPNGKKIARIEEVQQGLESRVYHISVAPLSGEDAVTVARPINLSDVAWSPEGSKLAYCEGTVVHVVDSNGATSRPIYVGPGGPYPGACFNLRWSDDGGQLSFIQLENVQQPDLSHPVEVVLWLGTSALD